MFTIFEYNRPQYPFADLKDDLLWFRVGGPARFDSTWPNPRPSQAAFRRMT